MIESAEAVVDLWFSSPVKRLWFNSTADFDRQLKQRFEATVDAAIAGALSSWEQSPIGSLALVILLDQFPLNIYRKQAKSFAGEEAARRVAERAIDSGYEAELSEEQKVFLYMPFMHSENLADQDRAIALFEAAGLTENAKYAHHHRDIVNRFGRFPHRNAILNRQSTSEELEYLNSSEAFTG